MPQQSPQSIGAFGMGIALGFGAGIAMKIFLPGATSLAEAILNRLGYELGDLFLSLWNPEEKLAAPLQLQASRRAPREKARRKMTVSQPAPAPRVSRKAPASKAKRARTPKNPRTVKPAAAFSSKRTRPLAMKIGMN